MSARGSGLEAKSSATVEYPKVFLTEALRRQKRTNKKLGEILIDMGNITPEDVDDALQEKR